MQDEVRQIAERDMTEQLGAKVSASSPSAGGESDPTIPPPIADVQETVDDVRAEIAATRSKLQSLRNEALNRSVPSAETEVDMAGPLFRRTAV